ncbi:MAG: glycoside hydrolase family 9 protein [Oscillospiraceae bacterium]|nr:glycoside hydrolase family 9 protein [Oscillospiraceae bacterium]
MLKSKFGKRLLAGASALAMVASATAASISTMTASAGELLGEGTFENGVGLPWHVCENGTGVMNFNVDTKDGVYSIEIVNPGGVSNGGEDRWDCQFRHRNLSITYGNTYRITYSVYATNRGQLYAKLGDVTNDDAEYWHSNGKTLSMPAYKGHETQAELESALKSASTGTEVPYYNWPMQAIDSAKTWYTFAFEFQINKSDMNNIQNHPEAKGTVEWAFHFGGDGTFTPSICFPEGTILKFDNLALIDMTGSENDYEEPPEKVKTGLVLNQMGYYPNLNKVATVQVANGTAKQNFSVQDASGKEVFSGTSSETFYDEAAGEYVQTLDFSKLTTEGTGYTVKCGDKTSVAFDISKSLYDDMLPAAMNYYYLNRSGIPIEASYVVSPGQNDSASALARDAGHDPDVAYITNEWVFIYADEKKNSQVVSRYKNNGTVDVTGGWYDAGDFGKYVVNGGVSMWTLANIFERDYVKGDITKWKDGSGTVKIPENGNGIPDILDELMWEADFFEKMQVTSANASDKAPEGMVFHKIHDYKWTALGVMPYDDTDPSAEDREKVQTTRFPTRIIKPVTYAATLNAAACWAQLSRLVQDYDSAKASEYLTHAKTAYAAAKKVYTGKYGDIYAKGEMVKTVDNNGTTSGDMFFAPLEQNKGGGPYGDSDVSDEFYWAACELYLTTGDSEYYTDLKNYKGVEDKSAAAFGINAAVSGGENAGDPTAFTWGTTYALGTMSLALHEDKLTADEFKTVSQNIKKVAGEYIQYETDSQYTGYGTPYKGLDYSVKVTTISGDTSSEKEVELKKGYGWGSNSMVVNNAIVMGLAYDLSDDGNGNKDVAYLNGVSSAFDYILGRNPLENSYVTGFGDSTTENPHHRYWCHGMMDSKPWCPDGCLSGGPNSNMNDPIIKGAGYVIGELPGMKCYYDHNDAWSVNEITINWNAPLVWVSSFLADEAPNAGEASEEEDIKVTLWGDADVDGDCDIIDVICVNKDQLGSFTLTKQGIKNADVDQNGVMAFADAVNIMKSLVDLVTLPVA